MNVGWVPGATVEARGLVAALGALALILARGTAVGFVAKREKDTVGGITGTEAGGAVWPGGTGTEEGTPAGGGTAEVVGPGCWPGCPG